MGSKMAAMVATPARAKRVAKMMAIRVVRRAMARLGMMMRTSNADDHTDVLTGAAITGGAALIDKTIIIITDKMEEMAVMAATFPAKREAKMARIGLAAKGAKRISSADDLTGAAPMDVVSIEGIDVVTATTVGNKRSYQWNRHKIILNNNMKKKPNNLYQ